jgi:hypothetical protein
VRLLGVKISNFANIPVESSQQNLFLFPQENTREIQKKNKIESVLDSLQNEFGSSITRASRLRHGNKYHEDE